MSYPYFDGYYKKTKFLKKPSRLNIVVMHGMANKVPHNVLREYCYKALTDGLILKNEGELAVDYDFDTRNNVFPFDDFKIAYWSDKIYDRPLRQPKQTYLPAVSRPRRHVKKKDCCININCFAASCNNTTDAVGVRCSNALLGKATKFSDTTDYFERRRGRVKVADIGQRLLDEIPDDSEETLVIGHSFGALIAYDAILNHTDWKKNKIKFFALGAPLGMPTVLERNKNNKTLQFTNFYDSKDPIAFPTVSYTQSTDILVNNDYTSLDADGYLINNNHKIYGYLRASEVTDAISEFLL